MRNKHTNKALKQGNHHYNDYKGNNGYIQVKKGLNIFTILKFICIICFMLIITFYVITKG